MANKVAVVCYLWGRWPEDSPSMGREYVRRLKDSVRRNSCLSYDWFEFGEGGHPLTDEFSSYRWNLKKMFMFSEESGLKGYEWVVAFDLDIVITGSVDFILKHRGKDIVTCRGAYDSQKPGGSVVAFDPSQRWTESLVTFLRDQKELVESETRGSERKYYHMLCDSEVFGKVSYWQDKYPGKIVSYKVDGYVNGASIVRFHGKPRPHQVVGEKWLEENWR